MIEESSAPWLTVRRGLAPVLLCMPHTGTRIPPAIEAQLASAWLARKDTDWWIERLYEFAGRLGASIVRTGVSRTVIDPNRDPSGASLYPGQATTGLCPTTTFDGEPLYRAGCAPAADEIAARRHEYFEPYHRAIEEEIARLRRLHPALVLYDCHSIRSAVPRLFAGTLPHFNLGSFSGASCAASIRCVTGRIFPASPTVVSRAATRPGTTVARSTACMPCRWSSPAAVTCASRRALSTRATGRALGMRNSPPRCAPCWSESSRRASGLRPQRRLRSAGRTGSG